MKRFPTIYMKRNFLSTNQCNLEHLSLFQKRNSSRKFYRDWPVNLLFVSIKSIYYNNYKTTNQIFGIEEKTLFLSRKTK